MSDQSQPQPHLFVPHAPTPASEHDFYFDLEAKEVPQYSHADVHTQKNDPVSFDQNVFNPPFEGTSGLPLAFGLVCMTTVVGLTHLISGW